MEGNEDILSDKKLLNMMEERHVKKMAELFSYGEFNEIINKYFKKFKLRKNETINIQSLQQFLSDDNMYKVTSRGPSLNNIDMNKDNLNNENNNLNYINKDENTNNSNDENTLTRNLTFSSRGNSLVDSDFIINTPPVPKNNNLIKLFNDDQNTNPYLNNISNNIIDNYYRKTPDDKDFDYTLLEKFENDQLTLQILLTILIYCLMKIKEDSEIKSLLIKYNIPNNRTIFPLILLKAKFYFKINVIAQSLNIYSEAINNYNNFKSNYNNIDKNDIIYIETYKQDFGYFNNLFNYLFALNDIDSKIKKLYYEQKFCLYYLNFYSQGFKLLIELYNKYPNDIQIKFELAKDSVFQSKYDIFNNIFDLLKKEMNEENDENKKMVYANYLYYLQGLSYLSQEKLEDTSNIFTELLKNDSGNVVLINNNALLNVYKNKAKESLTFMNLIQSPEQMDSYNEVIKENINLLKTKFMAHLQKTYPK